MMKYNLFFALVILLGCNQNERHQSEGRETKLAFAALDEDEFSIKRIEGKLFNDNLSSRIEMKIFKSPNAFNTVAITVSHYKSNSWKKSYTDTIYKVYLECPSISAIDLNKDGSYEFMFQRFEGMGNVTDYFFTVYAMKNGQIVKLKKLSSLSNASFQSNESTCTTFEKGDELYIGRKYLIDKSLNLKLIKEQHLFESKNQWLKKNYTLKNGSKIFENKKVDTSLDKEFYGFLHWCE